LAERDTLTKEYMSDYERFADVFNYFIYKGKEVIESEKLHELDPTVIALPMAMKAFLIPYKSTGMF
jgi:hypothetical protein